MISRPIFILSLFLFPFVLVQATDKVKIIPEPGWLISSHANLSKLPETKNVSSGYYLELVDEQVNLVNNTQYSHFIRHIVNQSGVQNGSEVSVSFSPSFQQVFFHKLTVIRNGQIISQLKSDQINIVQEETDASDFQYNGMKRAYILLKDIRMGDRIDFSFSISGFNPVFANRYTNKIYFTDEISITNYFQTIILPIERRLFIQSFNNAPLPAEKTEGNLRIYNWINPPISTWESEPGTPSWFTNLPYVSVSEYREWKEIVEWGLGIFKNYQYSASNAMIKKMDEWRAVSKGDKDLYALMAVRFVQDEIRYQGLEMGEYTHRPHDPSDVFGHRYGDCKDKALLLAMLLRHEHIDAYVAFVSTTSRNKLCIDSPSTGEFNHAIIALKRSLEFAFIDPTISLQRGELVDLFIPAYGFALILREGETRLQAVEPGFLNLKSIEEYLDLSSGDTGVMNVNGKYEGGGADNIRSYCSDLSQEQLDRNSLEYYKKMFEGIQLIRPVKTGDDSLKNIFTIDEAFSLPIVWHSNNEGRYYVNVFAKPIYSEIPNPAETMKNAPVALDFPRDVYFNVKIRMPEISSLEFDPLHIHNDYYQFDFKPDVQGSLLTLNYHFKTLKDNIGTEGMRQYQDDYKKMDNVTGFRIYRSNLSSGQEHSGKKVSFGKTVNWGMALFGISLLAVLGIFLRHVNNREAFVLYDPGSARRLGGWAVVLGITIFVSAVILGINLFVNHYFSRTAWDTLGKISSGVQYVFAVEMAIKLICFVLAGSTFFWFIGRRDIFPLMFIWYAGSLITGNLLLVILYGMANLPPQFGELKSETEVSLGRCCLYAAIWITYVLRSERVKNTFLLPS